MPIKDLIKFKTLALSLSLSLISNPEFSRRHNPFPNPVSGLFLKRSSKSIRGSSQEFDFVNLDRTSRSNRPFTSLKSGFRILHSCNGLLLCSKALDLKKKKVYYIYNPTTNQYTKLPTLPIRNSKRSSHEFRIEIYSAENSYWRLSRRYFHLDIWNIVGVFWNGSVHWISLWGVSLYFNVSEEPLSPLPMPPVPDGWNEDKKHMFFGESRGYLHFIGQIYLSPTPPPHLDMYKTEMDYSGWFVKFRVDLSELLIAYPKTIKRNKFQPANLQEYVFSVLSIVRGELDEESYLVLKIRDKVMRYNFKTSTFHKLCELEPSLLGLISLLGFKIQS